MPVGITPLEMRSSMIPVLMIVCPSGGEASTHPSAVFTCRPRVVARGSAVMRLMSPCSAAHTWPPSGACDIAG
jgi:hypothetical protein